MRIRTIALALALACGVTATVEAGPKHSSKSRTNFKPQKYKVKKQKVKHHR
jgi:hypothetical protein